MATAQEAPVPDYEYVNAVAAPTPTATAQPKIQGPNWAKLADDLKLSSPQEAAQRAYEIAAYVAEVQKSRGQKLLLKDGGKFYTLKLGSIEERS